MIVLVINKPVGIPELPLSRVRSFIEKLLIGECALLGKKPSLKYTFNPKVGVHRYVWRGQNRVYWQYAAHCLQ